MTKSNVLRFLAVVEQPANFNFATLPRTLAKIEWGGALPSTRSRKSTLDNLQARITSRLSKYLPAEGGRLLIWLLDDDWKPNLFITGLIDHRNGKLTRPQLNKWANQLLPQITCDQALFEMAITASATAELTFTDGYDFESSDYDVDERDEAIAQDMVDESCGHMNESYVSYVERDDDYLLVNAEIEETITVHAPWKPVKRLRPDQLEHLKALADDELHEQVAANQFVNLTVELEDAVVQTA